MLVYLNTRDYAYAYAYAYIYVYGEYNSRRIRLQLKGEEVGASFVCTLKLF